MAENPEKPNVTSFLLYVVFLFFAIIGVVFLFSKENTGGEKQTNETTQVSNQNMKQYTNAPKMEIIPAKKYTALVKTTKGTMTIELFPGETPQTVNNFVFLARSGYYDGIRFHRIVKDFMIQTGDPKGDGTGGPGYTFADEKISRDYKRGTIAMANRGPNTNGSQFFIMHKDMGLPKNYVIFGMVVSGIETVDAIANTQTSDNGFGEQSKPTEDILIEKISIQEK